MKYRKDFVTNSSSSSFVCDVCGYECSGMDMGLSDAGMYQCVNGHTFCEDESIKMNKEEMIAEILKMEFYDHYDETNKRHVYTKKTKEEVESMNEDEMDDILFDDRGAVPECVCPICQFKEGTYDDIAKYLMKKHGTNYRDVLVEMKHAFGTYEKLKDYIK